LTKKSQEKIIRLLHEQEELTLSEIVEYTGYSRSWVWKTIRRLESQGIVEISKKKGILKVILRTVKPENIGVLRIGILRAAEYPYIIYFRRRLLKHWDNVEIVVYDNAFKLATLLATGKVHLAMIPAVTALLTYRLSQGRIKIVGGGSGGGAVIIRNPKANNDNVATTMASSMEYCVSIMKLPGKRLYAQSGSEILDLVVRGDAEYGALWSPYTVLARRKGLKIETCPLPACCILAAHESVSDKYDMLQKLFADSVSDARRHINSSHLAEVYSSIVGLPKQLVQAGIREYFFYEEPPIRVLVNNFEFIRDTALPSWTVRNAVHR
jgi:predicted transcriptional regulator